MDGPHFTLRAFSDGQTQDRSRTNFLVGSNAPDEGPDVGWFARSTDAVWRRTAQIWRRMTTACHAPTVSAAMDWLAHHGRLGGLTPTPGDDRACPGLTAAGLETLAGYGQVAVARRWAAWLLSIQLADGAFPDAGLRHASLINTAQALRAFNTWADRFSECHDAARRAADYLAASIDRRGKIAGVDRRGSSFEIWAPRSLYLACLPPLASAALRWGVSRWSDAVKTAAARCFRTHDPTVWVEPSQAFVSVVEALIELGHVGLARQALVTPAAAQRCDGSVPAGPTAKWISSAGLARMACIWYALDEPARADHALACLRRRQLASGAFAGSWGRGACDHRSRESTWAVRNFLDAARLQVETAFERQELTLPEDIDPRDGRLQAARRWLAGLKPLAKVADLGCGPGRFVRRLAAEFPNVQFVGVDPSRKLLSRLPQGIETRRGGLLSIPAADGEFDGALAVESLEHSLLPKYAVSEICRVVRPGGSVLVIDKNRARQALSRHEPWEQWFEPREVAVWLSSSCSEVRVEPVDHGRHPPARPLFMAWTGTLGHRHPNSAVIGWPSQIRCGLSCRS
jgi:malonyl-CoA O-methyltransferase